MGMSRRGRIASFNGQIINASQYYDASGDLLTDLTTGCSYTYDAEHRISSVSGCTSASYEYNAAGEREHETVNGVIKEFINGPVPMGQSWAVFDGSNNLFTSELSLNGLDLGGFNGSTFYDDTDWQGTVRLRSNASGGSMEADTNLPFGGWLNQQGGISPIHYTGHVYDAETNLNFMNARNQSGILGRFMSPDPAGVRAIKLANPQTWNWYAYALNNPLRYTDPTGQYTCSDDGNKCQTQPDKNFEAARQRDLHSKDKDVAAAAAAYGDPTKNNHVAVQFTDAKNGNTSISISTNGKSVSYGITVSIPKAASGTVLDGSVDHEGTHTEQVQTLAASFKPNGSFNGTLNLTSYDSENGAYHNQATVWQLSGQSWSMNGNGQFVINPGDSAKQVSDTINQYLADPTNGYGVSPQKPGPPIITFKKDDQ